MQPRYVFELHQIQGPDDTARFDVERLGHTDSAVSAVRECYERAHQIDHLVIATRRSRQRWGLINPRLHWRNWSEFERQHQLHIRAMRVQTGVELCDDRAAEDLLVMAVETARLST